MLNPFSWFVNLLVNLLGVNPDSATTCGLEFGFHTSEKSKWRKVQSWG